MKSKLTMKFRERESGVATSLDLEELKVNGESILHMTRRVALIAEASQVVRAEVTLMASDIDVKGSPLSEIEFTRLVLPNPGEDVAAVAERYAKKLPGRSEFLTELDELAHVASAIGWDASATEDDRIKLSWHGPGDSDYLFDSVSEARCFLRGFKFGVDEMVSV